ncbi:MAG: NAD(P)/FAD-dependent oxidoreductase [Rhizobiaceae bacterium]
MAGSSFDVVVVGAGIAGAGVAAGLGGGLRVALLEAEDRPGYHTTGRSAAIFIQNYGNATIRALSRASAPLFDRAGAETPILSQRGLLYVAGEEGLDAHAGLLADAEGMKPVTAGEALGLVPVLRPDWLAAAAYEPDAQDVDVAALHQAYVKRARSAGAELVTNARLLAARRSGGSWTIETTGGSFEAAVIVNAAGAWADVVAAACGVAPIGIRPLRRSIAVLPAPDGIDPRRWPLVADSAEGWYAKPEAGRLLVSPADEDPVEPHDAFADDMVLAEGLFRFEQAVDWPVTRVERSWAGLRSFAPDRTPIAGFDPAADGFFWLAGQGGYGIQTAPALSRFASAAITRADPPDGLGALAAALSPARFRS